MTLAPDDQCRPAVSPGTHPFGTFFRSEPDLELAVTARTFAGPFGPSRDGPAGRQ
jgi:hypothetical protein